MSRRVLIWSAAIFYIAAGLFHFAKAEVYGSIVPPQLPWPLAAVYVSGGAEIIGGVGLLIGPLRRAAVFGLILLLVAVFPANIYMAVEKIQVLRFPIQTWLLWARLPVQGVLVWWLLVVDRVNKRD